MKASILEKLDILVDRQEEVGMLLSEASVISDQKRFLELSKEYAQNTEVVDTYQQLRQANADLKSANEMLSESDPEIKQMVNGKSAGSSASIIRQPNVLKSWEKLFSLSSTVFSNKNPFPSGHRKGVLRTETILFHNITES